MTNFWARRMNPAQQPPPAAQNTTGRPWWDTPPQQPAIAPSQYPTPASEPQAVPRQAQSARLTDACPECRSSNFMAPAGTSARKRCYDCGYPLMQAGSGGTGLPSGHGGPATPAVQIHDGNSNFNARNIVGRIA